MAQAPGTTASENVTPDTAVSDKAVSDKAVSDEAISYEAAREELLDVVRQLEAGGVPLEQSLILWERGEQLAVQCQAWLDGAKKRLAARRPETSEPTVPGLAASVTEATGSDDEGSP
jgi:exodeoxyribonuclease VII small subunit